MKLRLILTKPLDESWGGNLNRLYSPGYMFDVEASALTVSSSDPNFDGLTLTSEELECFRLIGETPDENDAN